MSHIAGISETNGFLIPLTIRARLLLQAIWTTGSDWDECVDPRIQARWDKWSDELRVVELLEIPRLIVPPDTVSISVQGFGDACETASAAVIYDRCVNGEGEIYTNFIAARAKIAPIKPLTIPRMELLAALLNYRLVMHYVKLLRQQFPHLSIDFTFWTPRSRSTESTLRRRATVNGCRIAWERSWRSPLLSTGVGARLIRCLLIMVVAVLRLQH